MGEKREHSVRRVIKIRDKRIASKHVIIMFLYIEWLCIYTQSYVVQMMNDNNMNGSPHYVFLRFLNSVESSVG